MSDQTKGRLLQLAGVIVAIVGLLTANGWVVSAVVRDIVRKELREEFRNYESRSESQMWREGNKAERTETTRRIDAELTDLRRRMDFLEENTVKIRLQ